MLEIFTMHLPIPTLPGGTRRVRAPSQLPMLVRRNLGQDICSIPSLLLKASGESRHVGLRCGTSKQYTIHLKVNVSKIVTGIEDQLPLILSTASYRHVVALVVRVGVVISDDALGWQGSQASLDLTCGRKTGSPSSTR
jgi:hypothetical protein